MSNYDSEIAEYILATGALNDSATTDDSLLSGQGLVDMEALYESFPERMKPTNLHRRSCYEKPEFSSFNGKHIL